jgi:hypothetical protein
VGFTYLIASNAPLATPPQTQIPNTSILYLKPSFIGRQMKYTNKLPENTGAGVPKRSKYIMVGKGGEKRD